MTQFTQIFKDDTRLGHKIPTSEYLTSGKYPIIDQGKHFISGYRNDKNGLYTDIPAIIFGDHTRILKYINVPFFIGADGVKILKPKIDNCNYKYLYYALCNIKIPNTGYNRHFKWLKEANITIPKLNIQNKVVNILDHINNIIQLREQQLSKLDQLVKSRFVEMFGDLKSNQKKWHIASFNDFAVIDTSMTTDFKKYANYPHIGIDCIEKNTGEIKNYRTVKNDNIISGKYIFTKQHIIYSKIRPNLNKVALPTFNGLCSADAYPILPISEKCSRFFLAYVMRSEFFLEYILQFSTRTNLPKVNKKELQGFCMPLPPLSLQEQFADFVQQVDKAKLSVKQSLEKLETLKKSLMQEYFG